MKMDHGATMRKEEEDKEEKKEDIGREVGSQIEREEEIWRAGRKKDMAN